MRYFIAGNFWLFIAFLLAVGRTFERSAPTRYSFFGLGHWFTPAGYNLFTTCVLFLALGFLFLHHRENGARRP